MQYVALLFLALLQIVLSVIFSFKKHYKVGRLFIYFSAVLFIWTLANVLLDYTLQGQFSGEEAGHNLTVLNIANSVGFFMGTLTLTMLYRIVCVFPVEQKNNVSSRWVLVAGIVVALLSTTPLVSGYYVAENAEAVYKYGPLSAILLIYFALIMVLAVKTTVRVLRSSIDVLVKKQAITILSSFFLSIGLALFLIIVLPHVIQTDSFIFVGYFSPYILTFGLFYSIFKQQFLNIKLIVARSVAYILLLSTLISIYGVAVYGIAGGLYADSEVAYRVSPLVAAVFIAFTAPYFKRIFDRITNNIFYRDSYDPQEFLDRLNKTIITNIELGILLRRAAAIIEQYMKSQYVVFGVYSNRDMTYRVIGTETKAYDTTDLQAISEGFEKLQARVAITETLGNEHPSLYKALHSNDISVAVRLSSVLDTDDHTTGYLFLGHKKSGNTYSKQDLRMVEIVADELVIAIQNSLRFEEIQQFNVTLQNRINQATSKVKKSNEKLQALDQTKDDFISMASHQLRTPLTSMKGYISMVLDGDVGPVNDDQRRMLQQAYISSQRMTYLISDLLNLSRLKTGKFVMDTGPVNLAHVIEQEVDQLKESAHSRNLKIKSKVPKEFPELELDETKIRQVIMNFLDNAIYYTPDGGDIEVELKEKAKNIELTVTDTGIGVPKNQQHHLFSKFYRAPNAKQARPDGTGLGLYMAKKVVVGQGGAVIFRSSEGKGSTFGFTFPKHKSSSDS